MAIRKLKRSDKAIDKVLKSKSWYVFFADHTGKEHSFSAGTDKESAQSMELWVKKLVGCRKSKHYAPEVEDWINTLPNQLKEKFAKWDLLSGCRVAVSKPLKEHLWDWHKALKASTITPLQADIQHNRVERIFKECEFRQWNNISSSKLMQQIDSLQKTIRTKNGIKELGPACETTKAKFLKACKQFCKWAIQDGRANHNPLAHLTRSAEAENKRRALTEAEIECLLIYTEKAGLNFNITGWERALIYRFAIETGFRANEISSLKRPAFDFKAGTVKLEGKYTKNRKNAVLPVRASTMERIQEHLKAKMPTAPAFRIPKGNTARMIQKDMNDARKAWIKNAKDNPAEHQRRNDSDFLKLKTSEGKVDFHSLRHTFGTLLASAGIHPKIAQELMRHSDVNLTLNRYSHAQEGQFTTAINSLPEFQVQEAAKTGTDNREADAIGVKQPEKNTPIFSLVQPTLHATYGSTCHPVAIQGDQGIHSSLEQKNADSASKTTVLTGKQGSAMIPASKVLVAQLDSALASEAKGYRFESCRGRFYTLQDSKNP